MRGARGLLISVTGGPDLTLYEVDEATTRIREEVDPDANIIFGATFDDTLEGTMRVSVVATGLALEAGTQAPADDEEEEEVQPQPRAVYGYTGKQPIPVKKPAPMAARKAATPAPQPQPATEEVETEMPAAKATPRMPAPEEFPPIAQQQLAARQGRIEQIADHAKARKKGLLERIKDVGLGRRENAPPQRETATPRAEPKIVAPAAKAATPATAIDPTLDDDQLEIPAFLRRQAS
jgi:cell division protein FtsZ